MTALPAPAMSRVFTFIDPIGLAKMAQVSKTWTRIVYRTSVWASYTRVFKPHNKYPHDLLCARVPHNARHIGEPDSSCFHYWLLYTDRDMLPAYFKTIDDPSAYYRTLHTYWAREKKPCLRLIHHKMTDILRVPLPPTISESDLKYITFRIYESPSDTRNKYSAFLASRFATLETMPRRATSPHGATGTDLLSRLCVDYEKTCGLRADFIDKMMRKYALVYERARRTLYTRSCAEFESNDDWYKRCSTVWDDAAFTMGLRSSSSP